MAILQVNECYVFCSIILGKSHRVGCKDVVIFDPLRKNHSLKCLTFDVSAPKLYRTSKIVVSLEL